MPTFDFTLPLAPDEEMRALDVKVAISVTSLNFSFQNKEHYSLNTTCMFVLFPAQYGT